MKITTAKLSRFMLLVCGGVMLSRILGLVRDIVFASAWGTAEPFAAFLVAFTFPNLLRGLFGEGVFSAAFVPFFTDRLNRQGLEAARQAANRVITALLLSVTALVAVAMLGCWLWRGHILASSFNSQVVAQLIWLLPYGILICAAVALGAVLNGLGHFTVPAYNPVVLNACLIVAASFVCPRLPGGAETQIYGLVGAVLVAGVLQTGWAAIACRDKNCSYRPALKLNSEEVRQVALLMGPALLGMGIIQFNTAIDRLLAAWLGSTATTTLYFAQRLVYLPVGLFGVAMSTVCLPAMATAWAENDADAVIDKLSYSLRQMLFMSLPAAALLLALRLPVVQVLFARGAFGREAVLATDWALLFYAPGIPAFVAAKIAVTPFYARQDTRTPVFVAAACLLLNLALNLILMQYLGSGGLALATTISSAASLAVLLYLIHRRYARPFLAGLIWSAARLTLAAAAAGIAAALVFKQADFYLAVLPRFALHVSIVIGSAAGLAVFLAAAALLKSPETGELLAALKLRRAGDSPK